MKLVVEGVVVCSSQPLVHVDEKQDDVFPLLVLECYLICSNRFKPVVQEPLLQELVDASTCLPEPTNALQKFGSLGWRWSIPWRKAQVDILLKVRAKERPLYVPVLQFQIHLCCHRNDQSQHSKPARRSKSFPVFSCGLLVP